MKYIYGYMQWKSYITKTENIWKLKDRSPLTLTIRYQIIMEKRN